MLVSKEKSEISLIKDLLVLLEKKEAIEPVVLNMSKTRLLTDYFVICTANSNIHMKSLRDEVVEFFNEKGKEIIYYDRGEGYDWVLIDAGDIVVHIFTKSAREFYDLEHLWIDAERVVF
ncbi:MAG: ribosome silencing factor [Fervidobacterium pennivorans]|uniref:Ribosomal silencing factor RsfS n=1 Tax=Fervidobacterium pennivorans TaxID=93466 RepID=A0A7C4VXQ0_FERPE|nr:MULTISPECIES: ribosome silencing factor [Fervidobacterium]NPU88932.1 ribosome silencing factor [Fervidobacterium sp.]